MKKEEKHTSQIHENIRKARFVKDFNKATEKFKYLNIYKLFLNTIKILSPLRSSLNWELLGKDIIVWITEVMIDGFTINFVLTVLLHFQFTWETVIAWGIVSKKVVEIGTEILKHGKSPKIHSKSDPK